MKSCVGCFLTTFSGGDVYLTALPASAVESNTIVDEEVRRKKKTSKKKKIAGPGIDEKPLFVSRDVETLFDHRWIVHCFLQKEKWDSFSEFCEEVLQRKEDAKRNPHSPTSVGMISAPRSFHGAGRFSTKCGWRKNLGSKGCKFLDEMAAHFVDSWQLIDGKDWERPYMRKRLPLSQKRG